MEERSVYPGEYKPQRPEVSEMTYEPHLPGLRASLTPMNVIEHTDYYEIEVAAPGYSKDDFFVTAHKDKINVLAAKKKTARKSEKEAGYRLHGFDYNFCECEAPLPPDADPYFVSAKYNDGVLTLCFFKTATPVAQSFHPIVVY